MDVIKPLPDRSLHGHMWLSSVVLASILHHEGSRSRFGVFLEPGFQKKKTPGVLHSPLGHNRAQQSHSLSIALG